MESVDPREKELQENIEKAQEACGSFKPCNNCRYFDRLQYRLCKNCKPRFKPLQDTLEQAQKELGDYQQQKKNSSSPQKTNSYVQQQAPIQTTATYQSSSQTQSQQATNTDQIQTLNDQLKQLQQNHADLYKQKQQSEQQLQNTINQLTEKNQQYQQQISNQATYFKQNYDTQIASKELEFQRSLKQYQSRIDSTTAQCNQLQQQNQKLVEDLKTHKQQNEQQVNDLNQKIKDKEIIITNLNMFVEHLTKTQNNSKPDLEQTINEKNKQIIQLESKVEQLEKENKYEKDKLDTKISDKDREIKSLNEKIGSLMQQITQYQQQQIQETSTQKVPARPGQLQSSVPSQQMQIQSKSFQLSPNFSIYHEDDIELGDDLDSGLAATVSSVKINIDQYAMKKFKEFNDFLSELAIYRAIIKSRKPNLSIIKGISLTYKKKKLEINGRIIMDLADTSFSKCIKSAKFITNEVAKRDALRQIIEALNDLHQSVRVAHLDLKPQNILVFRTEKPMQEYVPQQSYLRITDFGISKKLDGTRKTNIIALTVRYAPPEFFIDDSNSSSLEPESQQSFKSDIWSFGCIIVETYLGRIPYHWITKENEIMNKLYNRSIHPIDSIPAVDQAVIQSIPSEILDIARRCLQYDHKARPDSRELLELFKRI